MIRITTLLWVALLVVAGGTVMHVSYRVRNIDRHLAELAAKTRQEQDAIRILTAEWDSLNDPERIDMLSKRYLSLVPTPVQRVVQLEDIPLKPSPEQIAKMDAATAKSAKDHPAAHKPVTAPKPLAPAGDGVGIILARVEHRE